METLKKEKKLIEIIEKAFGEGSLILPELGGKIFNDDVNVVSTGSKTIDDATGIGGLPFGKIVEILGMEACLDERTKIGFASWNEKTGLSVDRKGGTIKRLYERFHGIRKLRKLKNLKLKQKDLFFTVPSFNVHECIFHNRIADIVKTGKKECYQITTNKGYSITATKEHKFFTSKGFVPLEKLEVGSKIKIHINTTNKRVHALKNIVNLSFILTEDYIKDIKKVGIRDTYDIKCFAPYNNYIANRFAVHNSGKTTLALSTIAQAQKKGLRCAFIDAEQSINKDRATQLGVDFEKLFISQPDSGEQALGVLDALVFDGTTKVIVVDSVAALTPQAEIEGGMSDAIIGVLARNMGKVLRKIVAPANKKGVLVIFINQIRSKIGGFGYGPQETTPGGNALKFYSTIRIDMRRTGNNKSGETLKSTNHKVTIKKNKLGVPFKTVNVKIDEHGFTT
jgi:RecA/RadA recombinase